jgi:glycosyltransferase involved in cell wall biosynthesis
MSVTFSRRQRAAVALPPDPLLSVVMPVFNEEDTVEEIIRRVLAVRMRIELIVVDDVSTDGTPAILERLQQELGFVLLR